MGRWKEHLAFNKRERYGVIVLCILLLGVSLVRASWSTFFPATYPDVDFVSFSEPDVEANSYESPTEQLDVRNGSGKSTKSKSSGRISDYFNPNTISADQWSGLGFSEKQAASLVNYRNSIGGFYSVEDVGSSFVVSEDKLAVLKPWMIFSGKEDVPISKEDPIETEKAESPIELNSADSLMLLTVRGIGPFYAGKIVQLRSDLGGFASHDQLLLLYGMDSIKLEAIENQTTIDLDLVKIRNINGLTIKELSSHKHIHYNLARNIVKYREQHGNYESFDDLLKVHLMNDSILNRIRPFFAVHD